MLVPKQETLTVTIPIICMTTVTRHIWPREKDYHLEQDIFIFLFPNNTISINLVTSVFSALLLQQQLVFCNLFFNLQSKRRNFSYIKRSCLLLTVMIKPQSPHEPVLQLHNCKEQHNQHSIPRSISSSVCWTNIMRWWTRHHWKKQHIQQDVWCPRMISSASM
jgi:hypothetical protein